MTQTADEVKTLARGERLIFVGGAPRSGTTLVQNMLDSHPEIFGGPEFLYLGAIVDLRRQLHNAIGRGMIDQFCSAGEADEIIAEMIEKLLRPIARRHGKAWLSEKSPQNALIFPELLELFPKARCIVIVRDPRATIASMLQVAGRAKEAGQATRAPKTALAAAREINPYLDMALDLPVRDPERVFRIVYKDLVHTPEAVMRQVCDFLGLAWSQEMLHPGERRHAGETAITEASNNIWYSPEMYNRDPDASGVEKWRSELTDRQRAVISATIARKAELRALGYDLDEGVAAPGRLTARAVGMLDAAKDRLRRVARKAM